MGNEATGWLVAARLIGWRGPRGQVLWPAYVVVVVVESRSGKNWSDHLVAAP